MEAKEMKIVPPEGYEIDKENSTFECIIFKLKPLTYEDVIRELFYHKESFSVDDIDIHKTLDTICYQDELIAKSINQLKKLIAINKLMNLAKYLNGDWKPDWRDENEKKWIIAIVNNIITVDDYHARCYAGIYFRTKELAEQAIDILGEDTIRLALSTDW